MGTTQQKTDILTWSNKRGSYTIHYSEQKISAWEKICGWKGLIPKVRTFLWKAVHGGLPTVTELHKRIQAIDPTCPRCGEEEEFLTHMLFLYHSARATWFTSPLSLRVDYIQDEFPNVLIELAEHLDENQLITFCNTLWNIWKSRNTEVFSSRKETPQVTLRRVQLMEMAPQPSRRYQQLRAGDRILTIPVENMVIQIDASWDNMNKEGWGMTVYNKEGRLVRIIADHC